MFCKATKAFFLSFISLCLAVHLQGQKLNIRNFTVDDGLQQTQILDIVQDHTGVIWLATNGGGVSRFDGFKFYNYNTKEGLNNSKVLSVFEDSQQNIWIGTAKGLNKFEKNKIVKVKDTLIDDLAIHCIHEHSNGEIWLGTSKGIIIINGKSIAPFKHNESISNFSVSVIKQDKTGGTWIGTMNNGVYCYDGKKTIHYGLNDGLCDLKNRDILITTDKIWITTYRGINILDLTKPYSGRQKFDTLRLNNKPFLESAYKLVKDTDGVIWIGNNIGVTKVSGYKSVTIKKSNGLCNTVIDAIMQDREGNMWFGSLTGGLSKYRNNLFINISDQQGLTNNNVMSFLKDSKENLWIATWGGGVSKLEFKTYRKSDTLIFQNFVQQNEGITSNNISSICEDKKGNIWFATSAVGVCVYDGTKFTYYDIRNGLNGIHVQAILADKKGNVWIAHENGVNKYDGETFTLYGKQQGFSSQGVTCIYEDDLGYIWFGSSDRVIKYDGRIFTTIIRSEGFANIKSIGKDKLGYMWFSTEAGAVVYNGKIFRTISESDGLASNYVSFIKSDDDGNLWIGTNKGIDKLNLDQFVNQKEVEIKHYGKEEGFFGSECNQNAFYKDVDGKLWIGTTGGITVYDPKQEKKNTTEPQTQIISIRLYIDNVDIANYCDSIKNGIPQNLKLPYDKNHITFDFIGISHTNPDKIRYQYKMEGADPDWSPEGKETNATYSNLAPGKYTFMLRASNNDGVWNAQPLTFSFEIIPPVWKRPWFYIIAIIMGMVVIYSIIKIRERSLKYSQRLLEREVNNRTRELLQEKEKLQIAYSEIDEKNKDITDSIHYAKRIQNALLPPEATMKQMFPDSFVLFKPKDIVSGDFYWVEQWGHQTLIAAADCTGHGVPGAFMSIVGHNILTQAVNVLGLSKPALILNETNKQLSRKLNQNPEETAVLDGMDIALCAINYTKSTMEFAGANNPIWIVRNNEVIEVKGNKFPIGAFMGIDLQKFTNHEWELQKGDYIYIFTDGYADQFGGPKGKKFKYKPLQQLLLENHKKPMTEQRNILEKNFDNWRGKLDQVDDVLVIGIRI